jgi:hypothetical protein
MKYLGVLALLIAALAVAHAAPARLPFEPPPPQADIIDLRGTIWSGWNDGVKADWVVIFEPDGVFHHRYNGATFKTGHWKQDGNRLYYEVNKKYCECVCTIHRDRIEGESWNVAGVRWKILLHRSK